jgi:hypothetical protein
VFDTVTITYRGAGYEIGRGADFYGIWTVGAPRSRPLERWPETPDGWSAAWTRFTEIEAPGTIAPVGRRIAWPGQRTAPADERTAPADQRTAPADQRTVLVGQRAAAAGTRAAAAGTRAGAIVAAALLAMGVILGIASLFPPYLYGQSLAQQPANLVPHAIYLATWALSAGLILLGGTRLRIGALLATGLSIVTFGLFFADAGTAIAGGSQAGAGLVLGLLGWLLCAAGSVVAFRLRPAGTSGRPAPLGRLRGSDAGPLGLLVLAGLGTAVAFAPSWDSYVLRTAAGQTQSLTAGNAFANPGLVIAGDVAVMVAVAAVVIAAALWRPMRHGAVLLVGAIIPMAAQAISALIQVGEPVSPAQLGISPAQASQLGLTISSGLTPVFWVYCVFVVALVVSCAWMFFTPHDVAGRLADPAGTGADPDAETDVWHVARADTYDRTGVRSPVPAGDESDGDDLDDEFDDDDVDSYEEFDSDDPADDAVTPGLGPAATCSGAGPGDESASRD